KSGWEPAGEIDVSLLTNAAARIDALVHLEASLSGHLLFALIDSTLFVRELNDPNAIWEVVETKTTSDAVKLKTIAPILVEGNDLVVRGGNLNTGLVGIDENNKLFGITLTGTPLIGTCEELLSDVASDIAPAAVRSSRLGDQLVAVAIDKPKSQ